MLKTKPKAHDSEERPIPWHGSRLEDEAIGRLANTVQITDDVLASINSCEPGEDLGLLVPKCWNTCSPRTARLAT